MRRLPLLVLLAALAALAPVAAGAVTAKDLTTKNVVFDTGVARPAGDLTRLETAAADLAAKGFPTKFVVLATALPGMDREARLLRRGLARALGPDAVDAVLVLAPHQLGVDAKVLNCERRLAFEAEVPTLKTDDIQGTINIARRLQGYDAQQALRDSNCNEIEPATGSGGGRRGLLIGVLVAAGLLVALAAVLARRAATRGAADETDAGEAGDRASGEDAPPPPDA